MPTEQPDITIDDVRARIRTAGVAIPEERVSLVHTFLRDALRPVRKLDTRQCRTVEPAPAFDAALERDRHGRR